MDEKQLFEHYYKTMSDKEVLDIFEKYCVYAGYTADEGIGIAIKQLSASLKVQQTKDKELFSRRR